jgi:hypothetical protein
MKYLHLKSGGTTTFLQYLFVIISASAQESVNKSFVRVRLYYLYLPMDVYEIAEFRIQELFEPLFKEK